MAKRRRSRRQAKAHRNPAVRILQRTRQPLAHAGLILATAVLLINGVVRYVGGGDTHPLSLLRLADKTQAITLLAAHVLAHPLRSDEEHLEATIARCAAQSGVSTALALTVARVESSLRPHAISNTGAMGLMQLMPQTAAMYGVSDPFDAELNAAGGVRFLKDLLQRYGGDARRVLAAYNAGPARVPRTGSYSLPPETQNYVAKILD